MPVIRGVFQGCSGGVVGAFRGCSGVFGEFSEGFRTGVLILLNHGGSCLVILFLVISLWVLTWRSGTSVIKVDQTEGEESMSGISSIECRAVSFPRSLTKSSFQSISLMGCVLNSVWGSFLHPPYTNLTTQKVIEWSKSWWYCSNSYPSSNLSFFSSFKDLKWPFTGVTKWHLLRSIYHSEFSQSAKICKN